MRITADVTLDELITAAIGLAGGEEVQHGGRLWAMEGGRACPLGWWDCSQPVFRDLASGDYDYGKAGGPGQASCLQHCAHGMQPAPDGDEGDA